MGRQVRNRKETKTYLHALDRYKTVFADLYISVEIGANNFLFLFYRIIDITLERSIRPWLNSDFIFDLTPLGRENRKCIKTLHNFTNQVMQKCKTSFLIRI